MTHLAMLSLALGPYAGSTLRGSIPGTSKFAVSVHGAPNAAVVLTAGSLPRGWISSFCTDRVCAPFRVHLSLPPSGRTVIELQLIENDPRAPKPRDVVVRDGAGASASIAFARASH